MNYEALPDHSRVWVYQCDRLLSDSEVEEIRQHGQRFIQDWAAHGSKLAAALEVFHQRFIVLFADESSVRASGCSIDASVRFIKDIQAAYQLDLFDRLNIAFKDASKIDTLRLTDFQNAIAQGSIHGETMVFNNLVNTKLDFENSWLVPLKESWHKQML